MFTGMIILAALPLLLLYLYQKLHYIRIKQHAAWPQLRSSLIWGHLESLHEFISKGETRRHIDIVLSEIRTHLGDPSAFVLDLRPVQHVLCVVCSHEVAEQVSRSSKSFPYSMTKSPTLRQFEPLLGTHSIITSEGEEWKSLRKRFNPGFAPQHLLKLLPCILDKAWYFVEHLEKYAQSGEVFSLADLCINLTFDIIGKAQPIPPAPTPTPTPSPQTLTTPTGAVTMDENLGAQLPQTQQSELVQLYNNLTATYRSDSSIQWAWLNPRTTLRRRTLTRRIDTLLKAHVKRKFTELKHYPTGTKSRSVLTLSLQDISHLDAHTLDQTCDQLKSFLFAGHDTTSILLQWAFYELSRTPRALSAIRHELDELFGPDTSPAAVRDTLLSPYGAGLITRMSYVSAVIKETLRLYPPSGTARYIPPGSGVCVQLGKEGRTLCLDGMVVYNCETVIQRDEAVYGDTKDIFMPERWLGDSDTSMQTNTDERGDGKAGCGQVPAGAWRPFERGPRNCIGQELANLEARAILACTVRRYDFVKVGLGEVARDESREATLDPKGQYEVRRELYNVRILVVHGVFVTDLKSGQTMQVTAKPVDGMRMMVQLASGSPSTV
ncbi:hypothetical protein BBP40_002131 [Aspergillus hancockii]|nr:hypothetical protein BBP40_002131 [Aspergillus hancockii]